MVNISAWQDVLQNTASVALFFTLQLSFSKTLRTTANITLTVVSLLLISVIDYFWYDLYLILPFIITVILIFQISNKWSFTIDSLCSFISILLSGLLITEALIKYKELTLNLSLADIKFNAADTLLCIITQYIIVFLIMYLLRNIFKSSTTVLDGKAGTSLVYISLILLLYVLSYILIAATTTVLKVQTELIVPIFTIFTIMLIVFSISSFFLFNAFKTKYYIHQQEINNIKILGYLKALEKNSVESERFLQHYNDFLLELDKANNISFSENTKNEFTSLTLEIKHAQSQHKWLNTLGQVNDSALQGLIFGKILEMNNFNINFKLSQQNNTAKIDNNTHFAVLNMLNEIINDAIEEAQLTADATIMIQLNLDSFIKVNCILPALDNTVIRENSILLRKSHNILTDFQHNHIAIKTQPGQISYILFIKKYRKHPIIHRKEISFKLY